MKLNKVTALDTTTAKLSWTKLQNISGYQIYPTSKNGTYKLIKTISSASTTSYKDTGLNKTKTYYYKVRGYLQDNDGTFCGEFSDVKI